MCRPWLPYGEWVTMSSSGPADWALSSRHNIPVEVTGLIGRERDIADIKQLVARTRLLTLTGVGVSARPVLSCVSPQSCWQTFRTAPGSSSSRR
jgi:hypothetical protein